MVEIAVLHYTGLTLKEPTCLQLTFYDAGYSASILFILFADAPNSLFIEHFSILSVCWYIFASYLSKMTLNRQQGMTMKQI